MYCICVLGDVSFVYYWRSHVLYMCVRGYQFYLIKTLTTGQIPTRTNKSTDRGIYPMIVIKTLTTGQIPTRTNKSRDRGIDPMIVIKTLP